MLHACRRTGQNLYCRGGAFDINLDYVKDPPEGEFANSFEIYNQETVASGLNVEFCLKWQNC
jgi:hypothetical protein